VAETVTEVEDTTRFVLILKAATTCRAYTLTFLGAIASELLVESVTTAPPAGAGAERVTSPATFLPPTCVVGTTVTVEITAVKTPLAREVS
jgi:hypothetical protein